MTKWGKKKFTSVYWVYSEWQQNQNKHRAAEKFMSKSNWEMNQSGKVSCRDGEEHIEELFRMYFQTFLKFEYKEEETVKDILGVSILENLVDVV